MSALKLVHYHAPNTRSATIRWLFEELGVPHELKVLNMRKGEHKSPEYLAINPMGKVPTIVHGDTPVTEAAAIALYLADLFPEAGLAPPVGDPARGTYSAGSCSIRRRSSLPRWI
ncbi:MAG TPA: glutathione S-transferase N-terminal domain-containing protein [Hyphomicrobium sp.]